MSPRVAPSSRGKAERRGHGHRFGNAAGLDEQVVEAVLAREPVDLLEQVVAQGAADAPIGHLDEAFLGP